MCNKKGMRLARFMSKEELYNVTLPSCQSGSTKKGYYWIGLKRNSSTGLLSWSDESKQFHFNNLSVCQNLSTDNLHKCQKSNRLCYNVHIQCNSNEIPHLHAEKCNKKDKGYICEKTGKYCSESRHVWVWVNIVNGYSNPSTVPVVGTNRRMVKGRGRAMWAGYPVEWYCEGVT